jgi:hypothetical protein
MEEKTGEIKKILEDASNPASLFSDLMGKIKEAKSLFEKKDFDGAIGQSRDSLDLIQASRNKFLSISMGYSITASTELISQISKSGVPIKEAEDLISKVTEHLLSEDFEKAHEGIGNLLEIINKLKEKQVASSKKIIDSFKKLIEEVKGIEADTSEAEAILKKAEGALNGKNYVEVADLVKQGKESAEKVRETRIQTIKDALAKTRSLIDESKSIGVDVSKPDKLYKEADEAFKSKDFKKCFELNEEAAKTAAELEEAQIKKVMEVQERRKTREKEAGTKAEAGTGKEVQKAAAAKAQEEIKAEAGIVSRGFDMEEAPAEEEEDDGPGLPEMKVISPDTGTAKPAAAKPAQPGAKPAPQAGNQAVMCSTCGSIMRYIEQYSRNWCDQCQKYADT